jgi:hypothetical protein
MHQVLFDYDSSIFSEDFGSRWTEFDQKREALENLKTPQAVHLQIRGRYAGIDYDDSSYLWLRDEGYFANVYQRIVEIRNCLLRIYSSKHTWILTTSAEALGLVFECALACDRAFMFDSDARLGIPEMEFGLFPLFGICEQLMIQEELLKRDFEIMPVRSMLTLREWKKYFEFSPHYQADEVITKFIESQSRAIVAKRKRKVNEQMFLDAKLDDTRYESFSSEFSFGNYEWRTKRPWILAWNLIRDRLPKKDPKGFAYSVLFLNSRLFLGKQFLTWLFRKVTYEGRRTSISAPNPHPVIIDLEFLVPPVEPLIRLIDRGFTIVLATTDVRKLKESLDLLAARLERSYHREEILRIWDSGITWVHAEVTRASENYTLMKWFPDDHVEILCARDQTAILRFQGNRGNSQCGWGELAVDRLQEQPPDRPSLMLAHQLCDGLIYTNRLDQIAISSIIRSLFLDELIHISRQFEGGLTRILPMLREVGWGFIADENSWEYFLRARDEGLVFHADSPSLGVLTVSKRVWQMGLWKEAREVGASRSRKTTNGIAVSHHLAMFSSLIVDQVTQGHYTKDRESADVLVGELAGFPFKLGTPSHYAERKGPYRTLLYWQKLIQRYQT